MTSQQDYGNASDSMLVPASLRVFRHFYVDTRTGIISPVNTPHRRPDPWSGPAEPIYPPDQQGSTFKARCTKRRGLGLFGPVADLPVGGPPPVHKSPDLNCTCGFYAHYKQDEDFYGHMLWGDAFYEESRAVHLAGFVLARAVCEVSGTTIAGSRGVRAEKIKIVAMAIDWDKYRDPRRYREEYEVDVMYYPDGQPYRYVRDRSTEPTEANRIAITDSVHTIVEDRYGAEFFDSHDEMYQTYPEADLSALGIEYKPVADYPSDSWYNWVAAAHRSQQAILQSQQQLYASTLAANKAANDLSKSLKLIFDDVFLPKVKVSLVKKPPMTQFERVMLAKQNRQAPPGTGIDRRRGRLR